MRNVWPSAVVSPIAPMSRVATDSARSNVVRAAPPKTNTTSMSDAYDSSCPPRRPMPITAKGISGLERLQRGFDARVGEVRQLASDVPEIGEPEQIP